MRDNLLGFFVDFGSMPQENEIHSQASVSNAQLFNQALALQQQQNWDTALVAYQTLVIQSLKNMSTSQASVVYHNMSTIAYEKGDLLKAYIWSKKSLALNSNNQPARQSLEQYSKKIEIPVIARQITNFDNFKSAIKMASIDVWLVLSLILIFLTLWFSLKNVLTSKTNQLANNFSTAARWPIYALVITTTLVISISYVRYADSIIERGIVVSEKAQVQTAPGKNKSVIFEAPAGLELEVLKFDQGYYQIRYPGAFSGWIDSSQLEIFSLNFEQNK